MSQEDEADWHLRAWMKYRNKKQSSLVKELGWDKSKAHIIWHSKQPYRRDIVNELASWLEIYPYELLMPPSDAISLRRLRETAHAIVSGTPPEDRADPQGGVTTAKAQKRRVHT